MELNKELIEKIGLSDIQVSEINSVTATNIAELKKDWDGKANKDAEAIIEGAGKATVELTGIQREQGQKWADYLGTSSAQYVEGSLSAEKAKLEKLRGELKDSSGDATIKAELDDFKLKYDELQKNEAEYKRLKDGNYEELYTTLLERNTTTELRNAFVGVKPNFPDSVNKYEADAKWSAFVDDIKDKYIIEFDDNNVAVAIDKNNKHMVLKLADIIEKDEGIQSLAKGRQQKGVGHTEATETVDGIPFPINPKASNQEHQKQLKDYLTTELKLDKMSSEYATKFAELWVKIKQKTAK
jgi:hypothetical protein